MPGIIAATEERWDYGLPGYLESPLVNFLSALGISGSYGLNTETTTAAVSANTAAINAALAQGGYVNISVPGVYTVNATLLIPDNTHLHIGAGVTLKLAAGTSAALLANKEAFTAATAIGSALVWAAGGEAPEFRIVLNKTGIAAQFPVGSYIGIMGLTSSANDQCFQGVWRVVATPTADSILFGIDQQPVGGGSSSSGGSYWRANYNISVSGHGTLDGNADNQAFNATVQFAGDPRSCLTWFRNVRKLRVRDIIVKRALSWGVASNNCADYHIQGLVIDTYKTSVTYTSDGIHLAGGHRQVLIENIIARDSDNAIGMTIDLPGTTIVDSYSAFYAPGNLYNIVLKNIFGQETSGAALIGIWGPASYRYVDILIDGIHGKVGASVIGMLTYAPTLMTAVTGGLLVVRNVTALCSGPVLDLAGDGTWDLISIETVLGNTTQASIIPLVRIFTSTTPQTIGQLRVAQVAFPLVNGAARSDALVDIGSANIGTLDFIDFRSTSFAANTPAVKVTGATGSIKKLNFTNCTATAAAAGTNSLLSVTGAIPITSITFSGCNYTGVASNGFMVNLGAASVVSAVQFSNCDVTTAAGLFTTAATPPKLTGANLVVQTVNNNAGNLTVTATPVPASLVSCTGTQAAAVLFTFPPVAQIASGFQIAIYTAAACAASTWASTGGTFVGAPAALVAGSVTRFVLNGTVWQLT